MSIEDETSPWHKGELMLQQESGVAARMDLIGRRHVRRFLIEQHREFYPLLPFVVLGAVDCQGDAWATIRVGRPGFLSSPDRHTIHVAARRECGDPADEGMEDGDAIGLIGIDLCTRRRNRANGTIMRNGPESFDIQIEHSFGNCPQYIRLRRFDWVRGPEECADGLVQQTETLDDRAREMITRADTFFVASYFARDSGRRQIDVSHRGGKPGFVRVDEAGELTIPDFAGNMFFNTLGNIFVNPKVGLIFPNFETGDLLQLTGDAEVILNSFEVMAFQGAERLWRVRPRRITYRPGALPLRWIAGEGSISPSSLLTGSWSEVEQKIKAAALVKTWRPFRIGRIERESNNVRSLYLESVDGAGLIVHTAGQHLPIRFPDAQGMGNTIRTYTLSTAPSDNMYRISVKKQKGVSALLHQAHVGDVLEVSAPAGSFTIDAAEKRPAVLLAAGIGITPVLSMLRHIVYEGMRKRASRLTWLFYGASSIEERAFEREIADLVQSAAGRVKLVRVLSNPLNAVERRDYEAVGRIDVELLKSHLPFDDYDFYLCGPPAFMQSVYDKLRGLNIADERIKAEAFGPASLKRTPKEYIETSTKEAATEAVTIVFAKSKKEVDWTPQAGTLLHLAENIGLSPDFGCRLGSCGTCKTRLLEGAVAYLMPPTAAADDQEALICCAVPAAGRPQGKVVLDL